MAGRDADNNDNGHRLDDNRLSSYILSSSVTYWSCLLQKCDVLERYKENHTVLCRVRTPGVSSEWPIVSEPISNNIPFTFEVALGWKVRLAPASMLDV